MNISLMLYTNYLLTAEVLKPENKQGTWWYRRFWKGFDWAIFVLLQCQDKRCAE